MHFLCVDLTLSLLPRKEKPDVSFSCKVRYDYIALLMQTVYNSEKQNLSRAYHNGFYRCSLAKNEGDSECSGEFRSMAHPGRSKRIGDQVASRLLLSAGTGRNRFVWATGAPSRSGRSDFCASRRSTLSQGWAINSCYSVCLLSGGETRKRAAQNKSFSPCDDSGGNRRGDCPFISALPSLLILKAGDRTDNAYLDSHLQSLVWESRAGGPASELLLARLWEVVFLLAFRTYLAQASHHATGWLAAIRDPQLARALGAIQQQPQIEWTVERLAKEAAMSRATFIRQFARVMGEPPMTFLYHHRMGVAASLLRQGETSLASVAARVGYGSEAAFSSAFRRHFGSAPGAYRARERA